MALMYLAFAGQAANDALRFGVVKDTKPLPRACLEAGDFPQEAENLRFVGMRIEDTPPSAGR